MPRKCQQCGYEWHSKITTSRCPHCHSTLWNRQRKLRPKFYPVSIKTKNGVLTCARERVIDAYNKANPKPTLRSLGEQFNISGERVRQILNSIGIDTHKKLKYTCSSCHKTLTGDTKDGLCYDCHKVANTVILTCSVCGKQFPRPKRLLVARLKNYLGKYKTNKVYCSRKCFGSDMGNEHGKYNIIAAYEQRRGKTKYSKAIPILKEAIASNQSLLPIFIKLNIPESSGYWLAKRIKDG